METPAFWKRSKAFEPQEPMVSWQASSKPYLPQSEYCFHAKSSRSNIFGRCWIFCKLEWISRTIKEASKNNKAATYQFLSSQLPTSRIHPTHNYRLSTGHDSWHYLHGFPEPAKSAEGTWSSMQKGCPQPGSKNESKGRCCFLFYSFIHSFIHSFTHSLIHSFTHSLIHSFTHSLIHSFTHSLTHSLIHLFSHSLIHSLIHSFTHSLTHSLIHSITHSLIPSFPHSLIHSLTHSFIHSFIHASMHPSIHASMLSFILSFIHAFFHSFISSFIHSNNDISIRLHRSPLQSSGKKLRNQSIFTKPCWELCAKFHQIHSSIFTWPLAWQAYPEPVKLHDPNQIGKLPNTKKPLVLANLLGTFLGWNSPWKNYWDPHQKPSALAPDSSPLSTKNSLAIPKTYDFHGLLSLLHIQPHFSP